MPSVVNAVRQSNTRAERRTPPRQCWRRQFDDDERIEDTDLSAWKQWEST
jgi:hypothetical protein